MGEKVIAETQYNDLLGTAAFDGHESPPVYELAECSEMPSESYWPVGFDLFPLTWLCLLRLQINSILIHIDDLPIAAIVQIWAVRRWAGPQPLFPFVLSSSLAGLCHRSHDDELVCV